VRSVLIAFGSEWKEQFMQSRNFLRRSAKQIHSAACGVDRRIQRATEMERLEVRRLFSVYNLTAVPLLTFQEGSTANLVTVATFDSTSPAIDLSAVINLSGVGTPSPDTAQIVASGAEFVPGVGDETQYSVEISNVTIGASTGANQLQYSVQVTDSSTATNAVAVGAMQVVVAPLTAGSAVPPTTVTEGFTVLPSAELFDFTDGYSGSTPADFTTTVDWGDGTPTSTGVVGQFGPGSFFITSGGHTYDQVGTFTIRITVQDNEFGGSTIESDSGAITINDATMSNGAASAVSGVQGQPLNNVLLGTFQVNDPDATAADYSAGVTWGDGSTADNGIVTLLGATSTTTTFGIYDSHEYAAGGAYSFSVAVSDKNGGALAPSIDGSATISGLTAGTSVPETGNTGILLSDSDGGSFTDANPVVPLTPFTATIDWGDGTPQSTGVIAQPGGVGTPFVVEGNHTYANPGAYNVSAIVVGDGTTTSLGTVYTITDLPVTGSTNNFIAVEGQNTGSFVLGTFEDPNTLATASSVQATLAAGGWGDGTPAGTDNTLVVQQIGVDPTNSEPIFEVLGSHTYADETSAGTPDILSIIVTTSAGVATTLTSPPGGGVTVLDAPLTGTSGNIITGVEGNPTSSILLGTFVDANQAATVTDYSTGSGMVAVDWGDGSAPQILPASDISAGGNADGITWAISAAHTYSEEGTYSYTVVVADDGGAATTVSGSAVIADAALTAFTGADLTPNTGATISPSLGSFVDANPGAQSSDFTTIIYWGDGSNSAGTITQPNGAGDPFTVTGTHVYATPGDYSITTNVADVGGSAVTLTGSATVSDLPVTGSVKSFTAIEGQNTGTVVLATFSDPNPLATTADIIAALGISEWGDGITTGNNNLTVTQIGGTSSTSLFEITGNHTFTSVGSFPFDISITTSGGMTTTLADTATVADAALTPGAGYSINANPGATSAKFTVATFSDANPAAVASDFSAVVSAANGTQTTTGTSVAIISDGGGVFAVTADLAFPQVGEWSITTTVTDAAGSRAIINSNANVTSASSSSSSSSTLSAESSPAISATQNISTGSVVVGTFNDSNPGAAASNYSAIIDWGDGSPTTIGTIAFTPGTGGGPATVQIDGVHTYANPGAYTILATTTSNGGQTITTTAIANVASDVLTAVATPTISTTSNTSTGSVVVSSFTDSDYNAQAGDFSAIINWGDGSNADTGTVSVIPGTGGNPATVTINGIHTYAAFGQYTVQVTTTSADGQSITTHVAANVSAPHLVFLTQPTGTTAGQKLSTFKVEAVDASGNIVAADHSVVTLIGQPATKANGKLLGNITVKLNRGVATFSNVSIDIADQYAIRAIDGAYAAAISSSFTITPSAVTHMVVSSVPTNAAHGSPFSAQVELLDQYGNIVNNFSTVTLKLGKHPHGAALSGTMSIAANAGVANFSNLVINQAGIYSLIATDKPLFKAASGKFAIS
jgi:large repetitive protein